MNRSEFERAVLANLRHQHILRPYLQAEDIVKFVFQGLLGVGHLMPGSTQAAERIRTEMHGLAAKPDMPLLEPVSPAWCRLNLAAAAACGLRAETISAMMRTPPQPVSFLRADVIRLCGLAGVPEAALVMLQSPDWLPSHSEAYRLRAEPHYRLIPARWQALMPAVRLLAVRGAAGGPCLVTLDGRCASGKTTVSSWLQAAFGAAVLHTDDFLIPHSQKTEARLAIPGGNLDAERLARETLIPWKRGEQAVQRRYDCHADTLLPPEALPHSGILLLEGSYCNVPEIRRLADIRLFLDTPEPLRAARLQGRESAASLERFRRLWIPLEEAYFHAYALPDADCVRLDGAALADD